MLSFRNIVLMIAPFCYGCGFKWLSKHVPMHVVLDKDFPIRSINIDPLRILLKSNLCKCLWTHKSCSVLCGPILAVSWMRLVSRCDNDLFSIGLTHLFIALHGNTNSSDNTISSKGWCYRELNIVILFVLYVLLLLVDFTAVHLVRPNITF